MRLSKEELQCAEMGSTQPPIRVATPNQNVGLSASSRLALIFAFGFESLQDLFQLCLGFRWQLPELYRHSDSGMAGAHQTRSADFDAVDREFERDSGLHCPRCRCRKIKAATTNVPNLAPKSPLDSIADVGRAITLKTWVLASRFHPPIAAFPKLLPRKRIT